MTSKSVITSDPSGATIYGSSKKNTISPWRPPDNVTPKTSQTHGYWKNYYFQVKKDGYEDSEIIFKRKTKPGEDRYVHFVLKPKGSIVTKQVTDPKKQTIYTIITSDPEGADIYWGDLEEQIAYSGKTTPFENRITGIKPTLPSKYFMVKKDGYHPSKIIHKEETTNDRKLHFSLVKTEYSYLKLTSNEKNVDIYINGRLVGQIQGEKPFNKKVDSGRHQIMAKKRFFRPLTIKIDLDAKEVFAYNFELIKATGWQEEEPGEGKIIQAKGNLTIVTERNDLKVFIDGVEKIPPFELKNIAAGIYELLIQRPRIKKSFSQTINDGENIFIDLDEMF